MPTMKLEIETYDHLLSYDLLETASPPADYQLTLPGGATLSLTGVQGIKAPGAPETIEMIISAAGSVATGLIANWLYNKLQGRATTLRINRREVQIENGEIRRIIEEQIQQDSN